MNRFLIDENHPVVKKLNLDPQELKYFRNNERDGIWTYFDVEGNIIKTERYIDGELIKTNYNEG